MCRFTVVLHTQYPGFLLKDTHTSNPTNYSKFSITKWIMKVFAPKSYRFVNSRPPILSRLSYFRHDCSLQEVLMYPALTGQANVSPAHGVSGATLDRVLVVLVLDEVTLRGNVKTAFVARKPDNKQTSKVSHRDCTQ